MIRKLNGYRYGRPLLTSMPAMTPEMVINTHNKTATTPKIAPIIGKKARMYMATPTTVKDNVKFSASLDSCSENGPRERNTMNMTSEGMKPKNAPKWAMVAH